LRSLRNRGEAFSVQEKMRRFSLLVVVVLALVAPGCSLGGGSGGPASHPTAVSPTVPRNVWAESWVKRLHPTGGAHFTNIKCDVKESVVVCTGDLYYSPGGAIRVPQFFRIRTDHDVNRVVPYCPIVEGTVWGVRRIFCR
jgi:hypothetical protein